MALQVCAAKSRRILNPSLKRSAKYTDIPVAVGFGISTPAQAEAMACVSDGAIVGSAIVKIVAEHGENADQALFDYVQSMKQAVQKAGA